MIVYIVMLVCHNRLFGVRSCRIEKNLLLAWLIHPLEERFDRSDPLYVMLALRKRCDG
jgi:hypothetical protein